MKFDDLRSKNLIEEYRAEKGEVEHILKAAGSDIETARHLLNTDVCWAFNIAYNAILQAGCLVDDFFTFETMSVV
jgi:hypothetical protein